MGTKFEMKGMKFSQTPGIGAHLAKGAMQAGNKAMLPELTQAQMKDMTQKQIMAYNRKRAGVNTRINRKTQRLGRKAAKLDQTLELKQAELAHGTIRQGLAEIAGLGAEGVGSYAITRGSPQPSAVTQNTEGGIKEPNEDSEPEDTQGPIARGKRGRLEE